MFKYSKLPDNLQFVKMREFGDAYPDAYAWIRLLNKKGKINVYIDALIRAESDVIDAFAYDSFLNCQLKNLLNEKFVINPNISYLIKISYNQDMNDFECSLCYNDEGEIITRKWKNE